jgi:hypothetical protein
LLDWGDFAILYNCLAFREKKGYVVTITAGEKNWIGALFDGVRNSLRTLSKSVWQHEHLKTKNKCITMSLQW